MKISGKKHIGRLIDLNDMTQLINRLFALTV